MSLPRYPEYKDSGVAWLGEVPGHWEVVPFYSVAKEREEPNKGMVEDNLLSLSYGRIVQKDISSNDGLLPESFETYQIVRQGDIVFRLTDLQNDKRSLRTGIVEETGIITSAYLAAMPFSIAPRYLNHLLRAYDKLKVFYSMGGGLRQSMKFSDVKRLPTLSPPLEEQQTIAAFLDREAGKIDALIAEQQRLVELLAEKRQAVISHAVTKGLPLPRHSGAGRNPAEKLVPHSGQSGCPATQEFSNKLDSGLRQNDGVVMKDSGIAWLGEVPEHWEVSRIKYVARIGNGSTPNRDNLDYWTDGDYPWLNSSVVNQDKITEAEQFVTRLALKECHLPIITPPVILVGITGQGRTRGMAATLMFEATINQHVAFVKPDECRLHIDFLRRVFDMAYQYLRTESDGTGSTKGAITCEQIARLEIPLPSLSEQQTIAAFLDTETAKFDTLTAEANRAIGLLQERRSALISAAVTGKIDVRGAVIPA